MSQCLIFCRTNVDCNSLEQFLIAHGGGQKFRADAETGKENPYSCCVLAGMRSNNERRASLEAFKEGRVRFLICTDVAARGIDIKSLPYVINMTLPDITEVESYIHRIGRVGRADKVGLAVSIVTPLDCNERVWYHSNCNKKQNCMNRKLLEEGGCTKWHTENATIRAIEKRLASVLPNGLPSLTPITFDLPEIYKKLDQVYGEQQTTSLAPGNVAQNNRIAMNTNKVAELRQLEIRVTRDFLAAQQKYNAVVGRPGAAAGKTGGATRESGSSSPKKKQKI
jgi:ATP-dependent RNA helicase DDX1